MKRNLIEIKAFLIKLCDDLEFPMVILGIVWLVLLIIELVWGLTPFLAAVGMAIWIAFILDFLLRFYIASEKLGYIRTNLLVMLSIALPALRLFRLTRALALLRFSKGVRLLRIITSFNRGRRALSETFVRGGFVYVLALTLVVVFVGAAGMYAFEKDVNGSDLKNYWSALWWTAMVLATMGSNYWPVTAEGRILCLLLTLYGFTIFGYITAILATFFVGRESSNTEQCKINTALLEEIKQLRKEINK